jgi:thiol-disulfide isomerase/thioredoxin
MRILLLSLLLAGCASTKSEPKTPEPQETGSELELRVLNSVQEMMRSSQGRVRFSELHNNDAFSPEEKAFLGRLYETFFRIPGYLKDSSEQTGEIPSKAGIASNFGITTSSVELLLRVMESDPRMPSLFDRDSSSGEITALRMEAIDGFVRSRGTQVKVTQWEGQPVPEFSLTAMGGTQISSADLKGQNTLLYFWFTGCPPCVRIAPILSELDRDYRDKGFNTIGLNADRLLEIETTPDQVKEYLEKNNTRYPNLILTESTRQAFGSINVYPTLFFVDESGTIVKHLLNFQEREALEAVIQTMLK